MAEERKKCGSCGETKSMSDFYNRRGKRKKEKGSYCKMCECGRNKKRLARFKRLCLEYKGGKCVRCGYDKCSGALVFHHRDPSEKGFYISGKSLCKLYDAVKKELDKCDLLCANCHAEVHAENNAG